MKIFKPAYLTISAVILSFFIVIYGLFGTAKSQFNDPADADKTTAQIMDISEEVSTNGKIKPLESADLAFEKSGKLAKIYANVGEKVDAGDKIAELDNSDAVAQVMQAKAAVSAAQAKLAELKRGARYEDIQMQDAAVEQASAAVSAAQAKLAELKRGARPEELQIAETNADNAKKSAEVAQQNLDTTQSKADAGLKDSFNNALTSAQDAADSAKSALFTLTDIQYAHFMDGSQDGWSIAEAKKTAVWNLLGLSNAGQSVKDFISKADGGAYGDILTAIAEQTEENVSKAVQETISSLNDVKLALEAVPVSDKMNTSEKASLDSAKSLINQKITAIVTKQQAIEIQKTANSNTMTVALSTLTTANNAFAAAKNQLALTQAGASDETIIAQEAVIAQAMAGLKTQQAKLSELKNGNTKETIAAQAALVEQAQASQKAAESALSKTIVTAPIEGIVTKLLPEIGEVVSPNSPVISVISDGRFEMEANISETDIAKVKIGDIAAVTTDAYGSAQQYQAWVVKIDPAETTENGISSYKITLRFAQDYDTLKSGMTANILIRSNEKKGILGIPTRAILAKGPEKFVLALNSNGSTDEKKVETGISSGQNGYTEIISGLKEGDVVLNMGK